MSKGTRISSIDVKKNKLTGPNALESQLRAELSPSTQQCPSRILVSLRDPGTCIHSPGSPINLFTNNCLWLLGHLWAHGEWSGYRHGISPRQWPFPKLAHPYLNKITSPCENLYCSMHLISAKTKSPGSNTLVSTNQKTKLFEYGLQHNLVVHCPIDMYELKS